MEGKLIVGSGKGPVVSLPPSVSIARNPVDLPGPLAAGPPRTFQIELEAVELVGRLANETTYTYWTFGGTVPGPMLRVRVGDTVELTLKNRRGSLMSAQHRPARRDRPRRRRRGDPVAARASPGRFRFKALNPGVYVYHCATPTVPHHIASGMYGLIVVEPEGGLPGRPRVLRHAGRLLPGGPARRRASRASRWTRCWTSGRTTSSSTARSARSTGEHAAQGQGRRDGAHLLRRRRPEHLSSFHVIGEIFDRVYPEGPPRRRPTNVQTTLVPAGGATIVEFKLDVPGTYMLVDHSLGRLEKGLRWVSRRRGRRQPGDFPRRGVQHERPLKGNWRARVPGSPASRAPPRRAMSEGSLG